VSGKAKPEGTVDVISRRHHAGNWENRGCDAGNGYVLHFDANAGSPLNCFWSTVDALPAHALLVHRPAGRWEWMPAKREAVDVLKCDRAWLSSPPTWSAEPQPDMLPFRQSPGIEYAHENDDMVVQRGALRLL
jgi:hypothetical protein